MAKKVVKKLVVISRCQDCPIYWCNIRAYCGGIPEACNLEEPSEYYARKMDGIKKLLEEKENELNG